MAKEVDGLHQNNNNVNKSDNKQLMVANNNSESCVTPNVPRLRHSFFNRKYRDMSASSYVHFTPQTPKITKSRTPTSRGRARKSTSGPRRGGNKTGGRPNRSRPDNYEFNDLDFSTPRATRNLLTPTRSARLDANGRITHLVYRPLELDNNDSSSDNTNDSFMRRHQSQRSIDAPLAIEAANAEVTLTIHDMEISSSVTTKPKNQSPDIEEKSESTDDVQALDTQPKNTRTYEVITIDDSDDSNHENETNEKPPAKKIKSSVQNGVQRKISEWSQAQLKSTQCITPPTTPPEKKPDKEVEPNIEAGRCSMFIPGLCNIEEIIHLYSNNK